MKTFEEIYRDAAVRNGCNAGKTFARVMFEEGMSQNLERCMDRAAGSHTDLMAFAGWFGKRLARESVRCNVNPEKPDVPLNKNDAFQKVQKRHVQEKR